MPRGDQLPGQQAGAAPELEHQAVPGAHRGEEIHDPGSDRGRRGTEAQVVDHRKVTPVHGGM